MRHWVHANELSWLLQQILILYGAHWMSLYRHFLLQQLNSYVSCHYPNGLPVLNGRFVELHF